MKVVLKSSFCFEWRRNVVGDGIEDESSRRVQQPQERRVDGMTEVGVAADRR